MKNAALLFTFLSIFAITSATASPIVFEKPELGNYIGMNILLNNLGGEAGGEAPRWDGLRDALTSMKDATEDQQAQDAEQQGEEGSSEDQTPDIDVVLDTFEISAEADPEENAASVEESGSDDKSQAQSDATEEDESEEVTEESSTEDANNSEEATEEEGNTEESEETQEPVVGNPQAAGIVALVRQEVVGGLQRRNVTGKFGRFQNYADYKLRSTARGGSEVTSLCRLKWYESLYRDPLSAPAIAEEFTRTLHTDVLNEATGLDSVLATAAQKLDIPSTPAVESYEAVNSPEEAIEAVKAALINAQTQYAASLATLNQTEVNELNRRLYTVFTRNGQVGHTLSDRYSGRRLLQLILKMDRRKTVEGLRSLARLSDTQLLDQLAKISDKAEANVETIPGVTGSVVQLISTSAGNILIGGRGDNTYQLDQLGNVNIVIDLGGNDTYNEGICNLARPVFVTIDLSGDDKYQSSRPGTQGGSVLGLAMLLDREGNDTYRAQDVAQGSTLGGGGILVDYAGNDSFVGVRRVQGQAIGGIGLLINRGADDSYRAGIWAQGFGGPAGFAMIDDLEGKDHYYAGGLYLDSYDETPGHEGWSQGIGAGIRQVANGGVGVMLDGGGDDIYEYDYIAHGGGYWLGLGFARDFGGNDQRLGATREQFNGQRRIERRFQRFSNGFGCHYALGFLIDDKGNDLYTGSIMGLGFAWDMAVGMLFDLDGDDVYTASGSTTKGAAGQAGLGILYDFAGKDTHQGRGQGYASSSIDYHDLPTCGGNFAFLIDYGDTDKYSCGARNNSYIMRGSDGGFLIDRPKESEVQQAAKSAVAAKGR